MSASQKFLERGLSALTRDAVAGRPGDPDAAAQLLLDPASAPIDVAAYLSAKAATGARAEDIAALSRAVLAAAVHIPFTGRAADIVGTGGDGAGTVNISTVAALLATAAGETVAKVGNRAATSRCGSADLLEQLGVAIDPGPAGIAQSLRRNRFAFVFSPVLHPAVGRLAPLRRALGLRTLFNLAGPLTNPLATGARVIGVADERDQEVVAEAAGLLGLSRTWVVRSADGMDELSTYAKNRIFAVDGDDVTRTWLAPGDLDLVPADPSALRGGDARANARVTELVLRGHGPVGLVDTCVLNAAAVGAAAATSNDPVAALNARLPGIRAAITASTPLQLLAHLRDSRRGQEEND